MDLTYENIRNILSKEDFSLLKDRFENEILDVKEDGYDLSFEEKKYELCKDVSAMLNNQGGFIIMGVTTDKLTTRFEKIKNVKDSFTFPINQQQYIQILNNESYLYPAEPLITVHESKLDNKDVFYIEIPQKTIGRPYLVKDKKNEKNFQYWIRTSSDATKLDIDFLHKTANKGIDYENHLKHIENDVEELIKLVKQKTTNFKEVQLLDDLKQQL